MRTPATTLARTSRFLSIALWTAIGLALTGALVLAAQYAALVTVAPPVLQVFVPEAAGHTSPATAPRLVVAGVGSLSSLSLAETILDREGQVIAEQMVPIALDGRHEGVFRGRFVGSVRSVTGEPPLHWNARYRLTAVAQLWAFGLPLPERLSLRREVTFSTPRTPQPLPSASGRDLRYGERVGISWNLPMAHVELSVDPPTRLVSWIDPQDPTWSYAALPDATDGRPYRIRIERAGSVDGVELPAPLAFTVVAPTALHAIVPGSTVPIRPHQRVPIVWTVPVRSFAVRTEPPTGIDVTVDRQDRRLSSIGFIDLRQGQTYDVEVSAVEAENGVPLPAPLRFRVTTPTPLVVARFEPAGGEEGLSTNTVPALTFSEAIADRTAAEAAIRIEPAVPGRFEWPADNQVRFIPEGGWPYRARIALEVAGGPAGPRGVGGGYLLDSAVTRFTTQIKRVIDVDLTRQRLVLVEDDQPVFESAAATGVPGGETPPGTFFVQYKMPSARFRGVNPDGSAYDIPNVPWVLAFWGDYTIHGAPWRRRFGAPGSAGCVSLPTEAARAVYEWAPVGTPIVVHY
ncbi:MAG: L,D-transpeptidase family protein [Chloroflexi bacterium]|nr:L,D-transpeptidase family protein [Chloroflexota bacterium]